MSNIRSKLVKGYYAAIEKGLGPVLKAGVTPDAVSYLALAVSLAAGLFFAFGLILQGGMALLLSGFLDTLDGSVARLTGRSNPSGALLDSTLDRYAEFFIFSGLLVHYRQTWMSAFVLLALMGSVMVSYIKARGQSLGRIRTVGLMQRPERFALLVAGSLANFPAERLFPDYPDSALSAAIILLAMLSNGTAVRRLVEGRKDLSSGNDDAAQD